jgi:hypothetical protein
MKKTYKVNSLQGPLSIDAEWGKPLWQETKSALIDCVHGPEPTHKPVVRFKLAYTEQAVCGIYQVQDQFVRAVAAELNGQVWKDSCVEFFFTPYARPDNSYFNLEINCCGVFLFHHQAAPKQQVRSLKESESRQIYTAGSLAGPIHKEIENPIQWTLEFAIPYGILEKYSAVERPAPGVCWHANLHKCADDCSHPHWLTWSPIPGERPNFHQPQYFGLLQFV